jgi:hypothetical protein
LEGNPTRVERFFRRLQNHPLVGGVLIFCAIIIGVATFTDAIEKLLEFGKKHVLVSSPQSNHERPSNHELQSVTRGVASESNLANSNPGKTRTEHGLPYKAQSESSAKPTASQNVLPSIPGVDVNDSKGVTHGETANNGSDLPKELPSAAGGMLASIPKIVPIPAETTPIVSRKVVSEEELKKETSLSAESSEQKTKPVPALSSLSSQREIREVVRIAESALRGQTMSSRVGSVDALLPSLPDDLNAKEVAVLTGGETMSTRKKIVELLVKRTRLRSLDAEDIPAILGTETMSSRVNQIRIIAPYIKPPITGSQAVAILGAETGSNRAACLRHIAPLLKRQISDTDVAKILGNISMSNRTEAIKILFDQAKAEN